MDADRTKLVADHVEYVRALAHQLVRGMPKKPDLDELVAFGLQGLTEAAVRYDANKGAAFKTFSYYRIRGAMYDGLRASGWLGRTDHARVKAHQQADDLLEAAAAVPAAATPDAVQAATLVKELLSDVTAIVVAAYDSFDRLASDPASEGGHEAIEEGVVASETRTAMQRALAALPERERDLVQKVYYGDQTIEEAGKSLGISKSWASRMHAKAIRQLKELLATQATELALSR
jgi:RNA polymerase sigma factor for flagellar operon FliA